MLSPLACACNASNSQAQGEPTRPGVTGQGGSGAPADGPAPSPVPPPGPTALPSGNAGAPGTPSTPGATTDASTATPPAASASRVTVSFDDQMKRRLAWAPAGAATAAASVVAFDAAIQPGVRVGGSDLVDFKLDRERTTVRRVTDPEFGPGQETVAVGVGERTAGGVKVERQVRVLLPDRHPDAVVIRSTLPQRRGRRGCASSGCTPSGCCSTASWPSRTPPRTRSPRTRGRPTPGARTTP